MCPGLFSAFPGLSASCAQTWNYLLNVWLAELDVFCCSHALLLVSSPPLSFHPSWLSFPSSFALLFSCVLHNPPPNLRFPPHRLALGKANRPSFSVFCCKYSHSRRSALSCTLARTETRAHRGKECLLLFQGHRHPTQAHWFAPSCDPSRSSPALLY